MDYEEKLTCFIDILGFQSAINQSIKQDNVREAIYGAIHELKSDKLLNHVYGDIPVFLLNKEGGVKPSRDVVKGDLRQQFSKAYPIAITQFSDSLVLSCPTDNHASCSMLLKCVYLVHLIYYHNLGMMVRGGISVGKLVHEEAGALFGPAMNEAYALESKSAIYPRVVISPKASELIMSMLNGHPSLIPLKKSFDGHFVFDLVSIFSWLPCKDIDYQEIEGQFKKIENNILENAKAAHPKIAYLIDQLELIKLQQKKPSNVDNDKAATSS